MSLKPGTRFGPYEILALLGAGGMGEVYRARDTRLDRAVAVKIVHTRLAADADQLRRFEQEARAASLLDHPNIVVVHDVGRHEGSPYIVTELLEGESLREKLGAPLPARKVVEYAVQIANGLAAAHEKGIVHRDLKPENLFVTKDGRVKILDFGVAKLMATATRADALTQGPTVAAGTEPGMVIGTVGYMSPEQVLGKPVDTRSDLFSLGIILYEMLAGQRPFRKDTAPETMAAIIREEPAELTTTNAAVPAGLDRVVRHCLEKEPSSRFQSARDVAFALESLSQATATLPAPREAAGGRRRLLLGAAALVALAGVAAGSGLMWRLGLPRSGSVITHPAVAVSEADELNGGGVSDTYVSTPGGSRTALAWTPDGQALVFVGRRQGVQQLYVRRLDAAVARAIAGTEGAEVPAVSADGQSVAFWADGKIKKVPLAGGPVSEVASGTSVQFPPWGMAWSDGGRLYFGQQPAATIGSIGPDGKIETVTRLEALELSHSLPCPLPGGGVVLFTVRRSGLWGDEEIVATAVETGQRTVLLKNAADARYVPTGHLVFLRQGTLFAVPFNPERLSVGRPVPLLDRVAQELTAGDGFDQTGAGQFAISSRGTLAWLPGPATPSWGDSAPVTVERNGFVTPLSAPVRNYPLSLQLSPGGRRLALTVQTLSEVGLWVHDLDRPGSLSPLVMDGEVGFVRWSPKGDRVFFDWHKTGVSALAIHASDGTQPAEVIVPEGLFPSTFSKDGRLLASRRDGGIAIVTEQDGKANVQTFMKTSGNERAPDLSPDGRWLAYELNTSPKDSWHGYQVYVRPYPGEGPSVPVSLDGGLCPAWNPKTGREIFFVMWQEPPRKCRMMVADFTPGSPARIGTPRLLFEFDEGELQGFICGGARCYDVSPDGQRFYALQTRTPRPKPVVTHINLIENWLEELKAKAPAGK
jgi:serine/threonine-protein kinase